MAIGGLTIDTISIATYKRYTMLFVATLNIWRFLNKNRQIKPHYQMMNPHKWALGNKDFEFLVK